MWELRTNNNAQVDSSHRSNRRQKFPLARLSLWLLMTVNGVAGRAVCEHEVLSDAEWVSEVQTPAAGLTSSPHHWCQSFHLITPVAHRNT